MEWNGVLVNAILHVLNWATSDEPPGEDADREAEKTYRDDGCQRCTGSVEPFTFEKASFHSGLGLASLGSQSCARRGASGMVPDHQPSGGDFEDANKVVGWYERR